MRFILLPDELKRDGIRGMTLPTPSFAPLITLSLFACAGLHANVSVYADKASFDAALVATGATADVVDFESFADNTLIAPLPQTVGGLTFDSFSTAGYDLIVDDQLGGTSGSNYLRVTSDGGTSTEKFGFDDTLGLSFAEPSNAIGLYVIVDSTSFDFFANDINITVNGITYSNDGSESASTVNGVAALFFGIVDDSASFTEASISVGDIGTGLGDYDDISFSVVPEPSAFALLATLSAAVLLVRRR
jgi:hypothetical protein